MKNLFALASLLVLAAKPSDVDTVPSGGAPPSPPKPDDKPKDEKPKDEPKAPAKPEKDPHEGKPEAGPGVPAHMAHPSTTIVVKNTTKAPHDVPFVGTLLPGENDVDVKAWLDITEGAGPNYKKPHPMMKEYLRLGHLEVVSGVDRARPITDRLSSLQPHIARGWIEKEENVTQLQTWKDNETRTDVREVIERRIEQIQNSKPQTAQQKQ